jgi:excisionase family DNA binding protein
MSSENRTLLRNLMPRNLRAKEAAAYIGVSEAKFRQLVKDGRLPQPFSIDGCVLWDRFDLDQAIDNLKAGGQRINLFDAKLSGMGAEA